MPDVSGRRYPSIACTQYGGMRDVFHNGGRILERRMERVDVQGGYGVCMLRHDGLAVQDIASFVFLRHIQTGDIERKYAEEGEGKR